MSYLQLAYLHLITIVPAFAIGTWLFFNRKGTPTHKRLGKVYMVLVLVTAVITLFMPAEVGPCMFGHFGLVHGFSLLSFIVVPLALVAVRRGNVSLHRDCMLGLYLGGIIIAGSFALLPGRLLHQWLFGA